MSRVQRLRSVLILLLVVPWGCLSAGAAQQLSDHEWVGVERIVAIGDVHGDYDQLAAVLRAAGLVDRKHRWSGGRTHLVQTGDIPDRAPDTRRIMDWMMKLEKQAARNGGRVHALVGNHEAMNVHGDLRYVHPGEFAAFKSSRSRRLRRRLYEQHQAYLRETLPEEELPAFDDDYRKAWEERHPLGFVEHRLAWSPEGKYGKWVAGHPVAVKIDGVLFLHGGLSPKYASLDLAELNRRARLELRSAEPPPESFLADPEGPLWYRGLAIHDESLEAPHLAALLERHGASRIVVGHTVTEGTVIPRFGGRVLLIDVGLSEAYGAREACLVFEDGVPYTLHRGERIELPASSDGVLGYLERAAALDPPPSPLAPRIAELRARLAGAPLTPDP